MQASIRPVRSPATDGPSLPAGSPSPTTLCLTRRFAATGALAALFLLALTLGAEGVVRIPAVRARLLPPRRGTAVPFLELELSRLEALSRAGEHVGCLLLGSSVVTTGLDPERLDETYAAEARRPLQCFNAGLPAMPAAAAGLMARLLQGLTGARLVIYAAMPRDFAQEAGSGLVDSLAQTPWVAYRLGAFSPEGWLVEHSLAYRAFLAYRDWLDSAVWAARRRIEATEQMTARGFVPADGPGVPFAQGSEALRDLGLRRELAGYEVAPAQLAGLVELAGLRRNGVQVALVELPTLAGALPPETGGRDQREIFVEGVGPVAAAEGMAFFRIDGSAPVPDDGWADIGHLNRRGAAAYSAWLGSRLARAVRAGELSDPAR